MLAYGAKEWALLHLVTEHPLRLLRFLDEVGWGLLDAPAKQWCLQLSAHPLQALLSRLDEAGQLFEEIVAPFLASARPDEPVL